MRIDWVKVGEALIRFKQDLQGTGVHLRDFGKDVVVIPREHVQSATYLTSHIIELELDKE